MTTAPDLKPSPLAARVLARLAELTGRDREAIRGDAQLSELIAESFALVEVAIELQDEFGADLTQDDLKHVRTAGELADLIAARATAS